MMLAPVLYAIAAYLIIVHAMVPGWFSAHIFVHVLYIFFPWEPKWLKRLHEWTGERIEFPHEQSH